MYQASVPVFIRAFENLSKILEKGEALAKEKGLDLINARLYEDMLPLSKQIQIASDVSKGGAARLAGVDVPNFADTETTFAELQERIAKTVAFLKTLTAEQIDGTEDKQVVIKVGGNDLAFTGQTYLLSFVLPNIYFHISVAYAILRHNGVILGKKDYLGAV
jgi:hypothetical protein